MAAQPDLQFRRLEQGELELASELIESLRALELAHLHGEAFGYEGGTERFGGCVPWGVFIRGELVGSAWLAQGEGSQAEVVCVAMAKGWWKMGLTGWVLEGLAKAARLAGATATIVRIKNGGPALGEILDDAGFSGPDPEAEDYPIGIWVNGVRSVNFG